MGLGGGMFFGLVILIVFGVGLYYAFLPRRRMRREDDAMDIASRRLARGEITVEEYEEIKKRLMK
jgi:putative membrane protein